MLEILPLSRHSWVVRYANDPRPLSEHPTLAGARADAIGYARQFGEPLIRVHELDGEYRDEPVELELRAPAPADEGPAVEP
jgi:hypothetical protein